MSKQSHHVEKFSKFLAYVLGRKPDEFGIVPDTDGFVAIKELLQALNEEPGWRHVRLVHLNEVVATLPKPAVEILESRIRAIERSELPATAAPQALPKLLHIAIRRRAYSVAMEKGLAPAHRSHLILAADMAMAMRIGRRIDNSPALLTVQVADAVQKGTRFQSYGRHLFLADRIVAGTFSGPALPVKKPEPKSLSEPLKDSSPRTPGSFFPDPDSFRTPRHRPPSGNRHKEPDWQKTRRQARRQKDHQRGE